MTSSDPHSVAWRRTILVDILRAIDVRGELVELAYIATDRAAFVESVRETLGVGEASAQHIADLPFGRLSETNRAALLAELRGYD